MGKKVPEEDFIFEINAFVKKKKQLIFCFLYRQQERKSFRNPVGKLAWFFKIFICQYIFLQYEDKVSAFRNQIHFHSLNFFSVGPFFYPFHQPPPPQLLYDLYLSSLKGSFFFLLLFISKVNYFLF